MTAALPLPNTSSTRLPDGSLLLSESLRALLNLLNVQAPSPLPAAAVPAVLEAARAAAADAPHPLLSPLIQAELTELEALEPPPAVPAGLRLFSVKAIAALKSLERKHAVHLFTVVASSASEALAHLNATRSWVMSTAVHVAIDEGRVLAGPVIAHSAIAPGLTPLQVQALTGSPAPEAKSLPMPTERAAASRPLSETQRHVLQSLRHHGAWRPGCGWLWGSSSNTRRILEALARRGLVTENQGAFTLTSGGEQALCNLEPNS